MKKEKQILTDEEIRDKIAKRFDAMVHISVKDSNIRTFIVSGIGQVLIATVYNTGRCDLINQLSGSVVKQVQLWKEIRNEYT